MTTAPSSHKDHNVMLAEEVSGTMLFTFFVNDEGHVVQIENQDSDLETIGYSFYCTTCRVPVSESDLGENLAANWDVL